MTDDETWVYHHAPESKQQSMQRRHSNSPKAKEYKTSISARKIMASVLKQTRHSSVGIYASWNEIECCCISSDFETSSKGNPKPTQGNADKEWEVLDHQPYNPDLTPSDFHLFRYLKSHFGGKSFLDDDEIKDEVEKCRSDNRRRPSMTVGYKSLCTDLTNVWIMGRFVEWAQNEIAVVPDFHKRILFSDEAHFWLNGYVNKQNCRIWSEANPQVYVETPLHPEKLTVWCALWAGGIIGPYFFKNDEGHNVTVDGDRCRAMITNFFIPDLNNHDVQELWLQQDGATCHTARATIDLLKDTFG
ncbi:DUF4817 domain-containing protein [Trichonephila clavipes]|nr:DUF4817 domain-containing protein [Trichonephila clavipes]